MRVRKMLAICLLIFASVGAMAQGFEGSVYFTKSNMMDVTQYAYHVKGNMVRIDEIIEGSDELVATLLVNLETEDMFALSHERNLYMKRPSKEGEEKADGVEIKEGTLKRSIYGIECRQIRLKKAADNRELMFWVTEGDYSFFPKLLKILHRKDYFSTYYLNIEGIDKMMPLMAEENTLLREKKGFLQVDKIEKKKLPDSMFEIPKGYEKVQR